jgi:prepilin-type N-terminal cleavage/methylation domain-containing protein
VRRASARSSCPEQASTEHGFTLIEVVVSVAIMGMIMSAVSAALVTSMRSAATTMQRSRETNDAQVVAGFFTRDAQSAGGADPMTGAPDPSLGVSTTDDAGCSVPGTLVARISSRDPSGALSVSSYSFVAARRQIVRTVCDDAGKTSVAVLANHVVATTSPKSPIAWCDDDETVPCDASSRTVSIRLTEINDPPNAAVPYSYTLTASLRIDAGAPTGGPGPRAPLILFGGAGCPAGNATGLSLSTALLRVNGGAFINSGADDPSCPAMRVGTLSTYDATNTSILDPGVCRSSGLLAGPCPAVTSYDTPIPDPYAGLTPPTGGGTQGGCPGGRASPGVYAGTLAIGAGTCELESGVYILRDGISVTTGSLTSAPGGVLLYITGGTFSTALGALVNLSPMTTGPYAGLVLWQDKADTTPLAMGNLAAFALNGTVYAPTATLNFSNVSVSLEVGGIVAQSLVLDTVGAMDIGP